MRHCLPRTLLKTILFLGSLVSAKKTLVGGGSQQTDTVYIRKDEAGEVRATLRSV